MQALSIPNGLSLEVLELDEVLRLRVVVADGAFAGCTEVLENQDVLHELAVAIRGFPASASDRREITLGAFGPQSAGGAVRLVLLAQGLAARAVLEAEVEEEPTAGGVPRTAHVRLRLEAAAIDEFVADLLGVAQALGSGTNGSAWLRGAA
jgi:hypothetical protein